MGFQNASVCNAMCATNQSDINQSPERKRRVWDCAERKRWVWDCAERKRWVYTVQTPRLRLGLGMVLRCEHGYA